MSPIWSAGSGCVLGRAHAVLRHNRQDAVVARASERWALGVVSDGCGSGRGSEVGAALSAAMVATSIARDLSRGLPLEAIAPRALAAVVSLLGDVAARVGDGAFAREHLLATVVAFAAQGDDAIVFAAGDGVALVDGEVELFERDNRPDYPAYELAGRPVALEIRRAHGARVLAVATDGFDRASIAATAGERHRGDLGRTLLKLQREGAFEDDGAIAIARRCEEASSCAS
jgi:hypothetical protein